MAKPPRPVSYTDRDRGHPAGLMWAAAALGLAVLGLCLAPLILR